MTLHAPRRLLPWVALFVCTGIAFAQDATFYLQSGSTKTAKILSVTPDSIRIQVQGSGGPQEVAFPWEKFSKVVQADGTLLTRPAKASADWSGETKAALPLTGAGSVSSSSAIIASSSSSVIASVPKSNGIPNVAVLEIAGNFKDFSHEDLSAITSRFETELMKTGKVKVLERRNMDMILQEQGFQQTGACNTSECQVQVGQLLGVDRIITGSLTKVDKLYTMNLKMVNVENGQNEISHALDIRGTMEDLIRGGCYEMAQIFSGLKKPGNDHTVLTAEKGSAWPWVIGGVAVVAGAVTTVVILNSSSPKASVKDAVIQ